MLHTLQLKIHRYELFTMELRRVVRGFYFILSKIKFIFLFLTRFRYLFSIEFFSWVCSFLNESQEVLQVFRDLYPGASWPPFCYGFEIYGTIKQISRLYLTEATAESVMTFQFATFLIVYLPTSRRKILDLHHYLCRSRAHPENAVSYVADLPSYSVHITNCHHKS